MPTRPLQPTTKETTMKKHLILAALLAATALTTPMASADANTAARLAGAGFVPHSSAEASQIHGEGRVPAWVVKLAVKAVKSSISSAISLKLYNLLMRDHIPSFAEYKAVFGSKAAAVLSAIPWFLRPLVAE